MPYSRISDELSLQNGCVVKICCLCLRNYSPLLDILPMIYIKGLLELNSDYEICIGGHEWFLKLKLLLKLVLLHDKTAVIHPSLLQQVIFPNSACDEVATDIVGLSENAPIGCRYAMTLSDYYSEWPQAALTSQVNFCYKN